MMKIFKQIILFVDNLLKDNFSSETELQKLVRYIEGQLYLLDEELFYTNKKVYKSEGDADFIFILSISEKRLAVSVRADHPIWKSAEEKFLLYYWPSEKVNASWKGVFLKDRKLFFDPILKLIAEKEFAASNKSSLLESAKQAKEEFLAKEKEKYRDGVMQDLQKQIKLLDKK